MCHARHGYTAALHRCMCALACWPPLVVVVWTSSLLLGPVRHCVRCAASVVTYSTQIRFVQADFASLCLPYLSLGMQMPHATLLPHTLCIHVYVSPSRSCPLLALLLLVASVKLLQVQSLLLPRTPQICMP